MNLLPLIEILTEYELLVDIVEGFVMRTIGLSLRMIHRKFSCSMTHFV